MIKTKHFIRIVCSENSDNIDSLAKYTNECLKKMWLNFWHAYPVLPKNGKSCHFEWLFVMVSAFVLFFSVHVVSLYDAENRISLSESESEYCCIFSIQKHLIAICYIDGPDRQETIRPLGYERVYLPLYKVADTPFHTQWDDILREQIYISTDSAGKVLRRRTRLMPPGRW